MSEAWKVIRKIMKAIFWIGNFTLFRLFKNHFEVNLEPKKDNWKQKKVSIFAKMQSWKNRELANTVKNEGVVFRQKLFVVSDKNLSNKYKNKQDLLGL